MHNERHHGQRPVHQAAVYWEGEDAFAAGDKQLGSCAAGKMKYAALCVQRK
jgi:hypothetical protein